MSEARNATTSAISSGFPALTAGIPAIIASFALSGITAVISVSIIPGAMAFTVMFLEANSFATDLVNPITPALLAEEYGKSVGSIKGVIRRRKEKENKEAQTGKEIEASVDAELGDIEEVEEESEEESEEPDDDCRSAMRTHLKPSFIRPRKKEMGRLYTGTKYRMRKKR